MKALFKENWTGSTDMKLSAKENETIEIPEELFNHLVTAGVKVEKVEEVKTAKVKDA